MFAVKNYKQGPQRLVAACDEDLLGTSHKEDKFRLEVPESFYDGMRVGEAELGHFLRSATIANLVGPKTVAIAIGMGLVEAEHVLTIGGVPHAQFLIMEQE